jgi:three-Cys-motif partner protein
MFYRRRGIHEYEGLSEFGGNLQSSFQLFGGDWTAEKLDRVRKYLEAYLTALKKQRFHLIYIDAFAGTGYRTLQRSDSTTTELLFPELAEPESERFVNGSARNALEIQPGFDEYIFIEKDQARCAELEKLLEEYPVHRDSIRVVNAEANSYLLRLCRETDWLRKGVRAVLFLDPFGMQVEWDTIKAIAETSAIDLWVLFPLGIGPNRLLKRDGNIDLVLRRRLDTFFGTGDWYDIFYETHTVEGLFGQETQTRKVGNFGTIARYLVERLRTVFPGVADNPLPLYNSTNNPLYLLCFAAGNPRGAPIAIRIAQHILAR